jgi:POT family proton-dependent oligopeptide transporter
MMGMWFMGAAIGNLVAGLVTRFLPESETVEAASANAVTLFGSVAAFAILAGLLFIAFAKPIRKLQAGVN